MDFRDQLEKVKFFEERNPNQRYQWGIYSFVLNGEENEIQVIVDYQKRIIIKNLMFITDLLNQQGKHIKQLKVLLKEAEDEIKRLEESNKGLIESVVECDSNKAMISEILSNLRENGFCESCKNKDKPVEWYMERGLSISAGVCNLYESED